MAGGCPFCGEVTPEYDVEGMPESYYAGIVARHLAVCRFFKGGVRVVGPDGKRLVDKLDPKEAGP